MTVGIDTVDRLHADATVCVELDTEPGRWTVLYGSGDQARLEWLRPGKESWLDAAADGRAPVRARQAHSYPVFICSRPARRPPSLGLGIALRLTLRELRA